MTVWLEFIGALALFFLGLRLSAFFSGTETGFYRVSFLRLSIEADAGDHIAERLMWFARNPSYFVATTLIGNNVANYITTFAIGTALAAPLHVQAGWIEVAGVIMLSPIVFLFGELMPKSLYLRAPLALLRRDLAWFFIFYRLFWVISLPLIWITKMFEKLKDDADQAFELVLGRQRLVQVLSQGHQQGLLTDVQNRMALGLLQIAEERISESITPANRVLGVDDNESRDAVLEYAKRYGVSSVAVKHVNQPDAWYGYLRICDVAISEQQPVALIRTMPRLQSSASKLETLLRLQQSGEAFGVVCDGDSVIGTVSLRGLAEQMIHSSKSLSPRMAAFQSAK